MTRKRRHGVLIALEPGRTCSRCKQHKECRPAGRGGAQLCFQCTSPDELEAYGSRLFDSGAPPLPERDAVRAYDQLLATIRRRRDA